MATVRRAVMSDLSTNEPSPGKENPSAETHFHPSFIPLITCP